MPYSCMLVDDEEDVINAIRRTIDWESLGFSVPTEAHNGLEALEFAEDSAPDVVLTDIKMPYMDGLELAHRLKELYPNIRIVVFSGFDEFEYAREALRLEAEEYILKPIHAAELSKLFLRIRERLDAERAERQNVEQLRAYYEKSLPRLQESFFVSLLDGKIPEEELMRQAEDYQLSFEEAPYVAAVIHTGSAGLPAGVSAVLLAASVRKLAEEKLGEKFSARFFGYLGNTVMLVSLGESGQLRFLTDACDKFCRLAAAKLGATVTVGIGKACGELSKLRDSEKCALVPHDLRDGEGHQHFGDCAAGEKRNRALGAGIHAGHFPEDAHGERGGIKRCDCALHGGQRSRPGLGAGVPLFCDGDSRGAVPLCKGQWA